MAENNEKFVVSSGIQTCIELKHCVSSVISVKLSQTYSMHLNWIRLATNSSWLNSSIGRAAVYKPKDASLNPA